MLGPGKAGAESLPIMRPVTLVVSVRKAEAKLRTGG